MYYRKGENGKFQLTVVFGTEACEAVNNGEFYKIDRHQDLKEYEFDTEAECRAFAKGLDEMAGWYESIVLSDEDVENISEI